MKFDPDLKYSEDHEWIRIEGDEAVLGISDYAQDQLSDVVYVELPEVGESFERGEVLAVVESVKAASDVYTPVTCEVLAVNEALEDSPEVVNRDPYGEAWFVRISLTDPAELDDLMDAKAYQEFVEGLDE
ncbi:MAG: glycine cleavage system protein GcvH [Anaerolineaceae bacterium]|jgi:glycine cleavage system H protein|nr:glycine cleavage system protein GcvH [Anaerolineae bacterium]MDX9832149.1 glycine cleavage system protein GcvH [Anaerolineae bacterium]NLF11269.1 glycine cleavage system protein GcvH [Anaerolineaceae bacterium]